MTFSSEFSEGDIVEWMSQAGGFSKTKRGVIIEIVLPGRLPTLHPQMDTVVPRNEISYVVRRGRTSRTSWPRTKHLRKVST